MKNHLSKQISICCPMLMPTCVRFSFENYQSSIKNQSPRASDSRSFFGRPPDAQVRSSRRPFGAPKRHQDASKTFQEFPKGPIANSRLFGGASGRPLDPQDASKTPQETPRGPKEAAKKPQGGVKEANFAPQIQENRINQLYLAPIPPTKYSILMTCVISDDLCYL